MKSANRGNALLVELLIVVMFFMLSATVLLRMFSTARNQSARAEVMAGALNEVQNVADRLYQAADAEAELSEMGFHFQDDAWIRNEESYEIAVSTVFEAAPNGTMTRHQVKAVREGEALITLPVARYRGEQP